MTNDEQLIDRIAAAMHARADGLIPAGDPLAQLRASSAPRTPSAGRVTGLVAALVSIAVVGAVVIVIGAIGPQGSTTGVASVPIAARGLVNRLAVLRRPQQAADRLPANIAAWLRRVHVDADPGLTRLAASIPARSAQLARFDIYVVVDAGVERRAGTSFASVRTVYVGISRQGRPLVASSGFTGPSAAAFAQEDVTPTGSARGLATGVLPDGVARVKWTFTRFPQSTAKPTTVIARVKNNVATAGGIPQDARLIAATWYSASGKTITSFSRLAQITAEEAAQARALNRSAHEPISPALLEHFSVFRQSPNTPIEPLPVFARASIAGSPQRLNIDEARFIRYPGTRGFWLVPGHVGVAIATLTSPPGRGLSTGGASLATALTGREIMTIGSAPPHETIYGLAPDGNQAVTIHLVDGTSKTVPVIDNAYALTLTHRPASLTLENASGRVVTVRVPG